MTDLPNKLYARTVIPCIFSLIVSSPLDADDYQKDVLIAPFLTTGKEGSGQPVGKYMAGIF